MKELQFLEEQQVNPLLIREAEKFRAQYPVAEAARNRVVKPPVPFYGKEILEMAIAALLQGENVLLSGSKATGKNILAENLAWIFGRPSYNISFNVNTDSSSLIGTDTFVDNEAVSYTHLDVYKRQVKTYAETEEISEEFNKIVTQMRTLDESRQEFVSNVSHELKTPLTSMKVLADSLLTQEEVPNELYKEFMGDIAEEIERENKIITDLLALVKMDKKAASLNIEKVDINDLLELILKRLRPIAARKNIEVVLESFRPVTAEVDESRLSLAFTNLVENAIKYNKENGWVHVSLDADHKFFYVKIMDSGQGIPEESLDYIFERFYRVDKSHSSEIDGTGLGLAIAKSAVLVHKGAIKVSSEVGVGTTFSVRIPLNYIA